jgi:predicted nucleotidyltransferase
MTKKMNNKTIAELFRKPEEWVHARALARRLRISQNTVRHALFPLLKKGVVAQKKVANVILFRPNFDSLAYKREKMLHNLSQIFSSGIVEHLAETCSPQAIILFGSYARGEDTSKSDIDIAVIGGEEKEGSLTAFEKMMGRAISIHHTTREDVSDEFFANLVNGIVLFGFLEP